MDDAELRTHLKRFYRFARQYVHFNGDLSKMEETLQRDDIVFWLDPWHIAKLRKLGHEGRSLWEFSSLIKDEMEGGEVPRHLMRLAMSNAYLELYLFDNEIVTGSDVDIAPPTFEIGVAAATVTYDGVTYADEDPDAAKALRMLVAAYPLPVGLTNHYTKPDRVIKKLSKPLRALANRTPHGYRYMPQKPVSDP